MKNPTLLFTGILAVVFLACTSSRNTQSTADVQRHPDVKPLVAEENDPYTYNNVPTSVDFTGMDPSVDPRQDFYLYANGNWLKKNPVPSTESSWGSFNELKDNNDRVLRKICEEAASGKYEKGELLQLIGDYYYAVTDSVTRDKAGIEPIKPWLNRIDGLKDKKALSALLSDMHYHGIGAFFGVGIDQDLKDNTRMAIYASQGGLSLPSRDYYFKEDTASVSLRKDFIAHVTQMLGFIGYKPADAASAAKSIYQLEESLAKASRSPVELRDPEGNYNKTVWKDLKKMTPSFDWEAYAKVMKTAAPADVIVGQPDFFKAFEKSLVATSVTDIRHYLKWRLLTTMSGKLSSPIEEASFAFYGTRMRGARKMKSMWNRALGSLTASVLSEGLGHAFVDRQFSEDARKRVNAMVDDIFAVFKDRLDTLEWMSDATRKQALHKLSTFVRKLGFPDKWETYASLEITRNSYVQNTLNCEAFQTMKQVEKLGKPIDKSEWGMPPHIVNAYYNPIWNEIVFPAGIMQPPFFDVNKEDAVNYARMGAVIGHELTHGFDDQGSQFDADGNLKNWWSKDDSTRFAARTAKLVECFNGYEALPGVFVNGQLTLGENIADLGGLRIAYYAFKRSLRGKKREKINGFTPEQRFFISFAQIWKTNYTDGALKMQVYTNPHSPGKYRVLGPLSNLEEFYQAFQVKDGDAMYKSDDVRAKIW